MNEETRYEYLKDTRMDLARPWSKRLKMEFGLGSAMFGISGVNVFPFPAFRIMPLPINRISIKHV